MKTIQNKFKTLLLLLLVGLAFTSCSKDDGGDSPEPENQAPNSFNLNEVADGAAQPQLSWEEATDPDGDDVTYKVYLDIQNPPQIAIANNLGVNTFSVEDELQPETTYYWKVIAKDSEGNTTKSDMASFTSRDKTTAEAIVGKWFFNGVEGQPPLSNCLKNAYLLFKGNLIIQVEEYGVDSNGDCVGGGVISGAYEVIEPDNQIKISADGSIQTWEILSLTETTLVLDQGFQVTTLKKE